MSKIKIEIFGKGCKNCERLEENVRIASANLGVDVDIIKVKDPDEILNRDVFKTPGLAINGKIVSTGRVLTTNKIIDLLE